MELLPTDLAAGHEVGVVQHGQVLHHAESGHGRQGRAELSERLAVSEEEAVEQEPPTRIGESPEHGVVLSGRDHPAIM